MLVLINDATERSVVVATADGFSYFLRKYRWKGFVHIYALPANIEHDPGELVLHNKYSRS